MRKGSAFFHKKKYILLPMCGLCFAIALNAQIVNVEGKRPGISEEGLHGSINLNFDYTRNVEDIMSYGTRNTLQYNRHKHRALFLTDLSRITAGGADFVNNGYEHLRYNYDMGEKEHFALEAFQQAQFNTVQKIRFRHLAGAGLRWNIHDSDSLKFNTGTLPMYEYEELVDGAIERNIRQSTYLFFFIGFQGFEFQSIVYYQPKINELKDFRLSNFSTVEFGLLRWLRYSLSLDLLYDSGIPAEVPHLVFTLKNGLTLEI